MEKALRKLTHLLCEDCVECVAVKVREDLGEPAGGRIGNNPGNCKVKGI